MPRFVGITSPPATLPTIAVPYNSGVLVTDLSDRITGVIFSDTAGTLFIEQSINGGTNYDVSTSYPIVANDGTGFSEEILAPFYRIRFVPTANPTAFRLASRLSSAGPR